MITSVNTLLQMVCHWSPAVWSPVSWAVSGAVRLVPCREACRPTSTDWGSAPFNISRRPCTSATTTASASSILHCTETLRTYWIVLMWKYIPLVLACLHQPNPTTTFLFYIFNLTCFNLWSCSLFILSGVFDYTETSLTVIQYCRILTVIRQQSLYPSVDPHDEWDICLVLFSVSGWS